MFEFSYQPNRRQQAFWLLLAFISFKFIMPSEHSGLDIPYLDKIAHCGIFFVLAATATLAYKLPPKWQLIAWAFYGAIIEMVQSQTAYRSAEFLDWCANMLGVLLYLGLLKLINNIRAAQHDE